MTRLKPPLADDVLNYLNVTPQNPDAAFLNTLMAAYIRRVPWESVSRIAKRARTPELSQRPRFAEEFWESALEKGTGGTCFESNYAFFALLQSLGYEGYLTINDMNETIGCHTAIIVNVDNQQFLVDAGFPLHTALPINPLSPSHSTDEFYTFTSTPRSSTRYLIERDRHPRPYCFTLLNVPITDHDYRAATTRDYDENGLFLDKAIVLRLVNERIWRFSYMNGSLLLESFENEIQTSHTLNGDVSQTIAAKFDMDASVIEAALKALP